MIGPDYGRFSVSKNWASPEVRTLCITQERGTFLRLPVRQFDPPSDNVMDDKGLSGIGRKLFAIPWALKDAASGFKAINASIDESVMCYVDHIIPRDDALFRAVFEVARRYTADQAHVRSLPASISPQCLR